MEHRRETSSQIVSVDKKENSYYENQIHGCSMILVSPYVRQIIEAGRGHINKRCVGIVEGQGGNMRTGWGGIVDPIDPLRFDRLELPLGS